MATEGKGVWTYSPAAQRWTQFHGKNGDNNYDEDNCYALCCDRLGRVWCGGLHGLAVFSQGQWRRFTPLDGPPGSRIFCLTTDPTTGDVWGGTEAGLFHYDISRNTWTDYSTLDGLPSNAIQSLAFSASGRLLVATQADGLASSSSLSDFHDWKTVSGPAQMPNTATGDGLPSPLLNCLLGTADGAVYAGTPCGLAVSRDNGQSWQFLRGENWRRKVQGLYHGPAPVDTPRSADLLTEDYVTCLAEDGAGHLWVGHWKSGWEERDTKTGQRLAAGVKAGYVKALLAVGASGPGGVMLVGGYRAGLLSVANLSGAPRSAQVTWLNTPGAQNPGVPASAQPPTLAQLNAMLQTLSRVPPEADSDKPFAVALDDDWQTEGDWLGRYGRYWACLCAMCSPQNYLWGAGWEPVDYDLSMGPQHYPGDSIRYWVHWLYTSNPKSLELPPTYLDSRVQKGYTTWAVDRRQSSVDDHGEVMSWDLSGPGVYATVTIPAGLYYLSLYEYNKDGQFVGPQRDYTLSLRPHVGAGLEDNSRFADQPELAHGRVRDFWGGVWKRFLVRGPQVLTVEVGRNNSFDTIVSGVMLDLVDEDPAPYFHPVAQWQARQAQRDKTRQSLRSETPSAHAARFAPAKTAREAAGRLFGVLQETRLTNPAWWGQHSRPFYCALLRWYRPSYDQAYPHPDALLASRFGTCAYQAGLLPQWEECQQQRGLKTARQIEKSLRWDGISEGGEGYKVVTNYLVQQLKRNRTRTAKQIARNVYASTRVVARKLHGLYPDERYLHRTGIVPTPKSQNLLRRTDNVRETEAPVRWRVPRS